MRLAEKRWAMASLADLKDTLFAHGNKTITNLSALSPTNMFNASSFSTRIGRVGFRLRARHRSRTTIVKVFTFLTSVDILLRIRHFTLASGSRHNTTDSRHQCSCCQRFLPWIDIAPSRANLLLRYYDAIKFSRNRVNGS